MSNVRYHRFCAAWLLSLAFLGVAAGEAQSTNAPSLSELKRSFVSPPDDARIMMRWWWFGPAVSEPELQREIWKMQEGGIGGFEIQPVYPLELDDPGKGFRNLPWLSNDFLSALRFANHKGRELGMRVDVTLASGWPFGGPHIPVTQASSKLRLVKVDVGSEDRSIAMPSIANGEKLLAIFVAPGTSEKYDASHTTQLPVPTQPNNRLQLPSASPEQRLVLFFVASRTGQMVKRPAIGAEGFVLDHMDKSAVENHLHAVGDRLMRAFGNEPPYAMFSDSLEAYGADWTDDLLEEFRARRGYDLIPRLPALFADAGADSASIRHDWGQTLTELVNERYLQTITAWAAQNHTRFRSQTYGFPAVMLSSNSLVDLPEGEGTQWRSFSTTRWATSGSHLYGKNVTSAETWTWLHSPAFRATPLDMKAEADRMFLQGVNQIVGHGWPYSPGSAGEPGWTLYAAGAFNEHNPWWPVMPELTRYLQRVSYLLRQGEPVTDVAIYVPTDDAWARFTPGQASITELMKQMISGAMTEQVLDAGFNFDYIDSAAIDNRGINYPVLILPRVDRIPLSSYRKIEQYAKNGGKVVALATAPALAPGLVDADRITPQIQTISDNLFRGPSAPGRIVESESSLGGVLKDVLTPDLRTNSSAAQLGFVHRRLSFGDIYFVVNTTNKPVRTDAQFRIQCTECEWWDPMSAKAVPAGSLDLVLAPYESRVLVMTNNKEKSSTPAPTRRQHEEKVLVSLAQDWKIFFPPIQHSEQMSELKSWTENPATRFFSGEAIYDKDVTLSKITPGAKVILDFGEGTPLPPEPDSGAPGMKALINSPVRETASVFVNGKHAGFVWCPPYRLDVTTLLRSGSNHIEIRVANLAINALAGRNLPDYRLLNSRYGERFQPQGMNNLVPLPAGMLGQVRLILY